MRLSSTALALIAAALAALLLIYVFTGNSGKQVQNSPHCSTKEALDLVKQEIFDRAAALRPESAGALGNVQNYSVLRPQSRLVRRPESDSAACRGTLALDLPPGIAAPDGRPSLVAQLSYVLSRKEGRVELQMLQNADAIVRTLAEVPGPRTGPAQAQRPENEVSEPPIPGGVQSVPAQRISPPTRAADTGAAAVRRPVPRVVEQNPSSIAPARPEPAAPGPHAEKSAPPEPHAATPAPAPVVAARPSFNCRYARTRGEIAVCSDPALAILDRQMASQFYAAMARGRPGQRAMLQRTRNQFLQYRDSCGSRACMADAYRRRMREIGDIIAAGW